MQYSQTQTLSIEKQLFSCKKCGACCKGYGGTYVTEQDIRRIRAYIETDLVTVGDDFYQYSGTKPILAQRADGYCIFWDQICTIHPVKPRMCKDWPFIPSLLVDPFNWYVMASMCPGIRKETPPHLVQTVVKRKHASLAC